MRLARRLVVAISVVVAVQTFAATRSIAFHQDPPLEPEPPFVVCENQRYALCAAASCCVYNAVAHCQCDIEKGDSISLQLSFSPGTANAGGGVAAPVNYGQCDGGIGFTSTTNKTFPGFDRNLHKEIIASCPIATDKTPLSSNAFGYQVFAPYHPQAPAGQRCDDSGCAACSVPNPTANGSIIPSALRRESRSSSHDN